MIRVGVTLVVGLNTKAEDTNSTGNRETDHCPAEIQSALVGAD